MPLREFDADRNRQQRERYKITIAGQEFRRRRMTGARFLEVLDESPQVEDDFDGRADEELSDSELGERTRSRARRAVTNTYTQLSKLIEPVTPGAIGIDPEQIDADELEDKITEWLQRELDWEDAPALLAELSKASNQGNAGA